MLIDVLEPTWSGAMEARGEARGLSTYIGRSSLYHSPPEKPDGEIAHALQLRARRLARRRPKLAPVPKSRPTTYRKWPPLTDEQKAAILGHLRRGDSYNDAARKVGVSRDQVRKVCKLHGIDRSWRVGRGEHYKAGER